MKHQGSQLQPPAPPASTARTFQKLEHLLPASTWIPPAMSAAAQAIPRLRGPGPSERPRPVPAKMFASPSRELAGLVADEGATVRKPRCLFAEVCPFQACFLSCTGQSERDGVRGREREREREREGERADSPKCLLSCTCCPELARSLLSVRAVVNSSSTLDRSDVHP